MEDEGRNVDKKGMLRKADKRDRMMEGIRRKCRKKEGRLDKVRMREVTRKR